uniref:Uncharacterized protein n=1 Tax=Romanomermis culicivorax TaxID=13658 RepID=A0A915I7G4_ROMCU
MSDVKRPYKTYSPTKMNVVVRKIRNVQKIYIPTLATDNFQVIYDRFRSSDQCYIFTISITKDIFARPKITEFAER